jgi:uncharacterized protein (DUF1778 family)
MQNKANKGKTKSKRVSASHYTVYLSPEEKSIIKAAADVKGQSATKYIKFVVIPQARKDAAKAEAR